MENKSVFVTSHTLLLLYDKHIFIYISNVFQGRQKLKIFGGALDAMRDTEERKN